MGGEWKEAPLSNFINLIGGGTPKRSMPSYWGGNIPWLSVRDFNKGQRYVTKSEESITELGLNESSAKLLDSGQIVISARGTVGELAQVAKPMAFNQSCYGIDAKSDFMINDFLYYLLKYSIDGLKRISHGAVFDTITKETFNHILVNVPPLPEQKAIAQILGSLDDKIELNRKMNATLEGMAQTLFKSWFVDFDPVIDNALVAGYPIPEELSDRAETRKQALANGTANREVAKDFPDRFYLTEEMGWVPEGWESRNIGDSINRLPTSNIYTKKEVFEYGDIPVFQQGEEIILGYHNGSPSFKATSDNPKFIFGDHTCVTHLSLSDFDISQNVIALEGKNIPTIWIYYAIQGKQKFEEYKRHWSEFVVKKICIAPHFLCNYFSEVVSEFYIKCH